MTIGIGLGIRFGSVLIGSEADVTAPTRTGIATNAAGTKIIVSYSESLDGSSVPALGAFTLAGPALSVLTGTPAVVGSTIELSVTPAISTADTGMTLSYTAGGSPIQDAAGNDAANFATQAVTNSSTHALAPTDIPGCVAWFDLQDAASFVNTAGDVSSITNKASSVVTTIAATRPAVGALNGHPALDFDVAATERIILAADAPLLAACTNAHAYTLFIVGKIDTVDGAIVDAFFGAGDAAVNSNNTRVWGENITSTGRWASVTQNAAGTSIAAINSVTTDTTPHVLCWTSPGTTVSLSVDQAAADPSGSAQDPTAGGASTLVPTRVAIGCRPDLNPDQFLDGQIGEIVMYDVVLTGPQTTLIANMLKAKWGTP